MNFFIETNSNFLNEYYFSILLFNVFSYLFILINLFILFFLFDLKYVKTLNELKFFGNLPVITVFLVIIILSFAGIPPLLGFLSKFLIFLFIVSKNNYLFVFVFTFSNMFIIYFYIQNLRFIVSKNTKNFFFIKKNIINIDLNLLIFFNFFNFFNVFALFYFNEFIIYLNLINCFINF